MRNNYYVYKHYTLEGELFYVGKGTGSRLKAGGNKRSDEWHAKTKHGLKWEIVKDGLTQSEAFALEKKIIHEIGYENLVNKKPGDGIVHCRKDPKAEAKRKKKAREATTTDEYKEKQSNLMKKVHGSKTKEEWAEIRKKQWETRRKKACVPLDTTSSSES